MSIFNISQKEINRRISAFTTLIVSLILGFILALYLLAIDAVAATIFLIIFGLILLLSRQLLIRFFNNYSKTKIIMGEAGLEREGIKFKEQISYSQISQIHVRRTTRGGIREIKVATTSGKILYMNAIDNFEKFREELIKNCGKSTKVSESSESIDYDHPLFYAILGLAISIFSVSFIGLILNLNSNSSAIINKIVSAFSTILGLYFLAATPLAKNYGTKHKNSDLLLGLVLVLSGISIYLMN